MKEDDMSPVKRGRDAFGLTPQQVRAAQNQVTALNRSCERLSADYNLTARQEARAAYDRPKLDQDRTTFESFIAEDYHFVDPFGKVYDRTGMIDQIMTGNVLFDRRFKTV